MSTPVNGSRSTTPTKAARVTPVRGILPVDESSLLADRPKPRHKLLHSISVSAAFHAIILFVLSWIYFDLPNHRVLESILSLVVSDKDPSGDNVVIDLREPTEPTVDLAEATIFKDSIVSPDDLDLPVPVALNSESISNLDRGQFEKGVTPPAKSANVKLATTSKSATSGKSASKKGATIEAEVQHLDHFVGRTAVAKAALLKRMGGTDASEAAVARGLVWLKNHQLPDGSWNFYHLVNPRCDCTMPGRMDNNPNGATAMALLAFLGAGQTHETGEYQSEVQQGLDYLLANGLRAEKGICFYGTLTGPPTYYTHGLVTITLSEAFAMTGDARLRPAISGAIDYLAATQDSGGGWRYFPGQPGDTSVVAWQLMALKSAQFSRITVPQKVFNGVDRFMRSVSSMRGSQYSYTPERQLTPTLSMTAAGLLCRMYLDWNDNGGLRAGVRLLDEHGPEPEGMYYNYYATQVMHHWGGPEWDRWNNVMREHLIRTQIRDGHATGSWDVADRHGNIGGRLYMTTLALLTLEVYYRHLPLYQKDRIEIPLLNQAADVKSR